MNRRTLLKNMFGAAVVTALPKRVVEQMESIPPDPIVAQEKDVLEYAKEQIVSGTNVVYIYDENQLIGYSHNFQLNMFQNPIPISKSKWVKLPWDGRYYKNKKKKDGSPKKKHRRELVEDHSAPIEYIQGLKYWDLKTSNMYWLTTDVEKFMTNNTKLNCLIAQQNTRISGDVYIHGMDISYPMDNIFMYRAHFTGSGALIMDTI